MPDIEIEIDGKKILASAGKTIIQVADENDIYIPRFCYHKKLSIAANCRMCLVEVEKAPKTLPACATPINPGMKVFTQSAKTLESQHAVMEFLLINHPLDCPICDQGGQCELQDFSVGYGQDHSDYQEVKRTVANDDFGPLIATQMTRCIHCTRCVRFGKEIAGVREIGMTGRGEHAQITTYVQHTVSHELSGNIIDLCPVGALLSKPFLFRARPWELSALPSIAPHDGVGSAIAVHTRRGEVLRVAPREQEAINENWLSDRDRFSYQGLSVERLEKPCIKDAVSGQWREVSWSSALNYVADAFEKIQGAHGSEALGIFLSPNSTLEEAYLLRKLSDHCGGAPIEYRVRQCAPASLAPGLSMSLAEVEHQKNIVLIGSHLRHDHPLLAHRVRQAALQGAQVSVIDSLHHPYTFDVAPVVIVKPSEFLTAIHAFTRENLPSGSLLIMGEYALNHPEAATIGRVLSAYAQKNHSTLAVAPIGANAVGCHRVGAYSAMEQKKIPALKAYLLHGMEPEYDVANPQQWERDLLAAELVVAVTPFVSAHLQKVAQVLLPSAAFSETSGTFINLAGDIQSFAGCVPPKGEARPAWKIFRVLGDLLGVENNAFESSADVLRASQAAQQLPPLRAVEAAPLGTQASLPFAARTLPMHVERISLWPDCRSDNLVRRAQALNQRASSLGYDNIQMSTKTAQAHRLTAGQHVVVRQQSATAASVVSINDALPAEVVYIAGGTNTAAQLGDSIGCVEIMACL